MSSRFCASASTTALPGANGTVESSSPCPNAAANNVNGAVTAFAIRLRITWMMSPPTENLGSSSEPAIGNWISMTPRMSLSSDTASSTGNFVAVGLSMRCELNVS